jgi:hypothetical protein
VRIVILGLAMVGFLIGAVSCATTTPVAYSLEAIPEAKARADIVQPLLTVLRDFGNNMAALMLTDYRFKEMKETGNGAYLYRFESASPKLPKYAYLIFRLEGSPSITTNLGERNYILLDGGSIGLVPADEPAAIANGAFTLQFTKQLLFHGWGMVIIRNWRRDERNKAFIRTLKRMWPRPTPRGTVRHVRAD